MKPKLAWWEIVACLISWPFVLAFAMISVVLLAALPPYPQSDTREW